MRLCQLTLQDFRNLPTAELHLHGQQQFFLGDNGQGKTNLLEAIGFFSALRSFRTHDTPMLVRQGATAAALAGTFTHEQRGDSRLLIRLRPEGKEVSCDGEKVTRFTDYLGRFPCVVFCAQDQQLLRGAPALRRRWLDLTLASFTPDYLRVLQTYHRALQARNALLRTGQTHLDELAAFALPLATAAVELRERRRQGVTALAAALTTAYAAIAASPETAALHLKSDHTAAATRDDWLALWSKTLPRDLALHATQAGPHRDDLDFRLHDQPARDYGSEGQQRTLVLALRLAQVALTRTHTGIEPIILADDVLGELDTGRRRRFWTALGQVRQVIATGTTLPDAELGNWQIFHVAAGQVTAK